MLFLRLRQICDTVKIFEYFHQIVFFLFPLQTVLIGASRNQRENVCFPAQHITKIILHRNKMENYKSSPHKVLQQL